MISSLWHLKLTHPDSQPLLHKLFPGYKEGSWCWQIKQKRSLFKGHWVAHKIVAKTGGHNLPRKSPKTMQLNRPNEKTKAVAPSPLSNYLLAGAQFDSHHCLQRHQASSVSGTQPYGPSSHLNHMALLSPSQARGVRYSSFSLQTPSSPESHTSASDWRSTSHMPVSLLQRSRRGNDGSVL